jgi:hypothetical protein
MTEYIVSTLSDKGNEIVVKRTDNLAEAQDYCDQCNRGSQRYLEQNPNAKLVVYKLYEVQV